MLSHMCKNAFVRRLLTKRFAQ